LMTVDIVRRRAEVKAGERNTATASTTTAKGSWKVGKAVAKLRQEGILVLSGGLTIHTFEDFTAFSEDAAKPIFKEFDSAILDAVQQTSPEDRKRALISLTSHKGFRKAHPREDHFVPLYVAAGAAEEGEARVISGLYGAPTFAFGV